MATEAARLFVTVDGNIRPFEKDMGRLQTRFGAVGVSGERSMHKIRTAALVAGAALGGGLLIGARKAFGEFQEAEKATAQTNAALKSTGRVAGVTAKQIEQLANKISLKAGIDDEAIQSSENLLLTFTRVRNEAGRGNDIFNRSTQVITDMSVALGQDLKSSTIQVGKALNDPIKGMTALRRVGVSFTQEQQDQVKALVASGNQLGAQKLILRELTTEFGGSAAAQATGTAKMKVAWENLLETVGKAFGPALEKASVAIANFANQVQNGTGAGGRFRDVVVSLAQGIAGVGLAFAPVGAAIASVAGGFISFAAHLATTQAGIAALSGIVGAFVGRMAGLAAAFVVGKVIAFAAAIREAGSAFAALTLVMRANPIVLFATAIGAVAGALIGLNSRQRETLTTTQQVRDAMNQMADAMRAARDVDIDAAQKKANLNSANVALAQAEQRVADLRRQGQTGTLAYRQAEADLAQARVAQKRAAREEGDQEADSKRKREDATAATRTAISTAHNRITTIQGEIRALEFAKQKFAGNKEAVAALTARENVLRAETERLSAAIRHIPASKKVKVAVDIAFGTAKGALGIGGPKGGPDIDGAIDKGVKDRVKGQAKSGKLPLGAGASGPPGQMGWITQIARNAGLVVTSSFRPGDPGWHGKNRARDYGGSAGTMLAFARAMAGRFGGRLLELIHTPLGFGIKNGQRVPLSFWGASTNAAHFNHVHVAYRQGGRVGGTGTGDKVPAMLEPGEFVMRKKVVDRFGPTFFNNLNRRDMALYAAGGMVRGKVSTFGPPNEGAGRTASGASSSAAGIALFNRSTLGKLFRVSVGGHSALLRQIDIGPAPSTGRKIDITGAGARKLGINPRSFPTDSIGSAALQGGGGGDSRGGGGQSGRGVQHLGNRADHYNENIQTGTGGRATAGPLATGAAAENDPRMQWINTISALADLSPGLDDDIFAAKMLVKFWDEALTWAKGTGNLENITTAATNLAQAQQALAGIPNPEQRGIAMRQALARLTSDTADDVAAATELVNYWGRVLDWAKATGNEDFITQAANGLADARQGLDQLTQAVSDNTQAIQEQNDLLKQQRDDARKLANVSQAQYAAIRDGFIDWMMGGIGGRVTVRRQSGGGVLATY